MTPFETRHRFGPFPYVFGALLGVSLGLIIVSGVFFFKNTRGSDPERPPNRPALQYAGNIDESRRNAIVAATESVSEAVVGISTQYTRVVRTRRYSREWLQNFFNVPEVYEKEYTSLGSGVMIDSDGYILTNEHVIRHAEDIQVTLVDGREMSAAVVASAAEYDLALIKIEGGDYPFAPLGDSDSLLVGEWAIAIGQPFGQLLNDTQPTVTVGVISALHRDVKGNQNTQQIFKDMIQTDAAINPGNSGGPLINSSGEVIGINTFIFSTGNGGNLGMGFAIPINRGRWVLEEFIEHGKVREVWVGLRVRDLTPQIAASLNLDRRRGLLIGVIEEGSPAEEAGLKPGDLIVEVNGVTVNNRYEANRIIFGSKIGDRLEFEIVRSGRTRTVSLKLREKADEI